jgi:hypothetical protein
MGPEFLAGLFGVRAAGSHDLAQQAERVGRHVAEVHAGIAVLAADDDG